METVGFIGLGSMGAGMAGNIAKVGYPLVVHDVRAAAVRPFAAQGARVAGSPAEVAGQADVIVTSVPGPREVEAVGVGPGGPLDSLGAGLRVHCSPLAERMASYRGHPQGSVTGCAEGRRTRPVIA